MNARILGDAMVVSKHNDKRLLITFVPKPNVSETINVAGLVSNIYWSKKKNLILKNNQINFIKNQKRKYVSYLCVISPS